MFVNEALAQTTSTTQAPATGASSGQPTASVMDMLFPLIPIMLIMYFLIIRPQQRQQKQHRQMLSEIKHGDEIITSGGLHGKVTGMDDTTLTIQIAANTNVKIERQHVQSLKGYQVGAKK